MTNCDVCGKGSLGFSILGIMPPERIIGRKSISVCMNCMDVCPCGDRGDWWGGLLTCRHGFSYKVDYAVEPKNRLIFIQKKRKWWSFLRISKIQHETLTNESR